MFLITAALRQYEYEHHYIIVSDGFITEWWYFETVLLTFFSQMVDYYENTGENEWVLIQNCQTILYVSYNMWEILRKQTSSESLNA